jgi:hypothetical protein
MALGDRVVPQRTAHAMSLLLACLAPLTAAEHR